MMSWAELKKQIAHSQNVSKCIRIKYGEITISPLAQLVAHLKNLGSA